MTLNIQSPDITLKQEVIDFLNQKLNVLARRYNEIISVNAPFGKEKYSTNAR
jgi:ribosome-associated translation inhibitor RaiA